MKRVQMLKTTFCVVKRWSIQLRQLRNPALSLRAFFVAASLAFLLVPAEVLASVKIDLTVSTNRFVVDRTITWNLGTTGMRGWIDFGWPETPDQGGITDFAPYQILVTAVGTNTPAYGILATDDVILGAIAGTGTVPLFTHDARQSLGWALGDAEAATGVLKLKRWRAGVTTDVSITLPVMGAYSATAPYNCAKTALVMTNAAKALAQRINTYGWGVDGPGSISAVALLSTGITNYLPMLQTFARQLAPTNMNAEASGGIGGWSFYDGIFLAEYYMLTGDAQVLHGLSEYVLYGARHMSMYGSGMSGVPPPEGWEKGGFHGSCPWYGPINNCTLVVQLTIALGKKAGITDVEMAPAIARASNFYSYFVGRGCIPYGEHAPYCGEQSIDGRTYWNHRSNGKDGLAAILFNVIGDRPVQAQYYSRMALAEYNGEWNGHTGQGFSYLWTELGANVGGTNAAKAYQQKMRWDRDMKRRLDGSFVYEGGEQMGAGYNVTDYWDKPQAEGGPQVYYDNATAYYLIHAAIPLQKLYITGKNPNPTNQLSVAAVSNALWSAQYPETCGGYTTNQLISHLSEYDPIVRMNAATELSLRPGASALIPQLIALAANPTNANQRAAACYTLGVMHTTAAVPTLVGRLADTDYWVRYRAAEALGPWNAGWQGSGIPVDATLPYLTSMMATYITNATPTYPLTYGAPTPGFNWDDPMQQANGMLGVTIFNPNNLGTYTINQPKNLLWPAVKAGIKHPSGDWLGNSMDDFMSTLLTLEDVKELAVDLFQMAELPPPLCAMYNESGPFIGKRVLSKYHIFEGIDICMNYTGFWGWGPAGGYDFLWPYLESARQKLPGLIDQKLAWSYTTDPVGGENYLNYMRAITEIDAATNAPALVYGRPYAAPQIAVTPVNTAKAITLVGSSCRTSLVTYAISAQPAHGALSGSAPNLTYTPAAGYQGMDSFTFTATDYLAASTPGTVHIVVGAGGIGVKGQYYDNVNFTTLMATVTNPAINFAWGTAAPVSGMAATTYSVRWTGQVLAPESGLYRFSTRTSDGARLWVNGKLVIDDWNDQPTNLWNDTVGITLTAGSKYNLKMEYYRNTTPATARLYWYMPSRPECTVIPQELLYPVTGVSLTSPTNGAGYASASSVTLTADVADMAVTVTNVAFYNGAVLLGNDTTAPYAFAWSAVPAGEYPLTARAAANNGTVSTSAVSVITVDGRTVPVSSGLVCWYDAAYGVTVDRKQSVRAWEDRSGNGHNAVLHFNDGNPELMQNQLFSRPSLRFNNYMGRCWLDVSRPMFVKEQYVIARNYTINPWNSGAFLGRSDTGQSSYLLSGTGFEWAPAGVSKNGTVLSSPFNLAPTTDWMVLKITVDDSYTTPGPYMIGGCGGYYATKFDVAEIIGYSRTLTAQEEAAVGGYIESKYGVTTAYTGTGSLANQSASGLTTNSATLNGTLICNGTNYGVTAYWGMTDGGLNPANWANSATVGSWNKAALTNFSLPVSGLLSGTTYYFTFRGTNTVSTGTIWAAPSQSFTTISTAKEMLSFGANVAGSSATINTAAGTVAWTVPYGTGVSSIGPIYTVSPFASGLPASGTSRNFTTPQTYTITGQDGSTKVYTVTVFFGAPSSACDLLTFGPGAVINGTNITWSLPYETDLTVLAPTYTASFGATGVPVSGAAPSPNFAVRNPATYTITAQDGVTTKHYSATVTLQPYNPEKLSNGSFEIGKNIPSPAGYTSVSLPSADLSGWSGNFTSWYIYAPDWGLTAPDGSRIVNLNGATGADVVSQSFPVAAGMTYTVSYYERIRGNGFMDTTVSVAAGTVTGAAGTPVAVSAGPAASIVQTTAVNSDWTLHTFTFTPNTTTTATVTFGNHYGGGQGDNDGVYLDNVSVTGSVVPTVPAAPTGLTATGENAHVDLSWAASSGATGYRMKRSLANNGPYSVIGTSAGTAYIDNAVVNGTTYYYVVSATNSVGESANSTQASATPVAANQAPVITEGATTAVTMSQNGSPTPFSLTLHATDADNNTITWSVSTPAAHGTATASGTGTSKVIGYTPTTNYTGADSFVVQVSDGNGGTDTITVNVTITSIALGLVIGEEQYQADGAAPSPIGVLSGDLLETSVASVTDEPETISGVAPALRSGSFDDFVMYNDSAEYTTTYTLDITAHTLGYDINEIRLFSNGGSRTGQSYDIKYSLVGAPGTFLLLGTYTDTLYGGASGTLMTRTYNTGGTAILTGVAAIQFVIRPTQLVGGSDYIGALYREWDVTGSATGSVAAPTGLTAVGGDAHVDLSWAASSGATGYKMKRSLANGGPYSVIGTSVGTAYIDNAVVNGTTYYYVVSATNSAGESANSTQASATPVAANQAPVITQGATAAVTMSEDGSPTAFSLTLNATDANGDTITWSVSTPAAHGTATASGTGTSKAIGYTPTANYNGADSFVVQVSDGNGGTDTIIVNVTIQSVNDAPVVSLTAPTNGASFTAPATLTLTATASDVDGTITTVGFYNGATLIASDTTSPYSAIWSNVTAGSYSLTARATDNSGLVRTSAVVSITVTSGLPSPWQSQDVGIVGRAGSATYSNGTYTVKGAGSAIGGTVDSLRYVYQLSSGDCDIKLRVASLTNTVTAAKAGVMIRESLNSNAREAGVWVTPSSGIIFTRRTSTGGTTATTSSTGKKAPYWVRLTRGTNSFSAYYGTNGTTWTKLGSTITISMSTNAYMGMAVCSGATNTLSTSTMDNVIAVP